ncbi:MAG: DNA-binding NarL/FixJ family response regulator [Paracoccaceae bacterium]|jgi:DNA-binding NarL/FixJ family response regulator
MSQMPSPSAEPPYSVLVVEDRIHTAFRLRDGVEKSAQLTVCGVAHDLDMAWSLFERFKPRFVLTDLGLPDGSGVEIIRAVANADWTCDSMVVSVFGDEHRAMEALRAGANGYLLKNTPINDIGAQILNVINGGSPMSPQIARHLLSLVHPSIDAPEQTNEAFVLTPREQEVCVWWPGAINATKLPGS